ncbi:MAG: hypothetical protein WCG19_04090 [Chlorobiaceae bacterium]
MKIEVPKNTVPQSRVTKTQITTPGGSGFLFVEEYISLTDIVYEVNIIAIMQLSIPFILKKTGMVLTGSI